MKKLKIPLLIIVSLGLLLVFALLPKLVSRALDAHRGKTPSYSDIKSLELELSPRNEGLSDLDKLSLLARAEALNLRQDQMSMTQAEVEEVITAHLSRMDTLGLCQAFEPATYSLQPKLMYDLSDAANNFALWTASFVSPHVTLLLDVDDETGNILCISYHIKESFSMDGVWARNQAVAEKLTEFYFSQFGLLETARDLCFSDYREVDGGVTEVIYTFHGFTPETFQIQFNIEGTGGFTIYLFF